MTRPVLAMIFAASAASAQAQPVTIQPSVDTVEQRQSLRSLMGCVAEMRGTWARQLLSKPYLSDAQARSAGKAFEGRDRCIRGADAVEVTFRTSSIVSNLAEYYLRTDLPNADQERLERRLNTLTPLNASEDFALCVASRAPSDARAIALSDPGSSEEAQAAARLGAFVPQCAAKGESLTVDLQGLRGLMSIALYRAVTNGTVAQN